MGRQKLLMRFSEILSVVVRIWEAVCQYRKCGRNCSGCFVVALGASGRGNRPDFFSEIFVESGLS